MAPAALDVVWFVTPVATFLTIVASGTTAPVESVIARLIVSKLIAVPFIERGRAYLPSTENASNTFPGSPPQLPYPEATYNMPPATTGPGQSNAPPLAGTPFTAA